MKPQSSKKSTVQATPTPQTKTVQAPLPKHKPHQPQVNANIKSKVSKTNTNVNIFEKENYIWMGVGIVLVLLGMLLMIGGKSTDPNVFNEAEIYSFRRITLAPIVFVLGLVVEFYAIFKKPKNQIANV